MPPCSLVHINWFVDINTVAILMVVEQAVEWKHGDREFLNAGQNTAESVPPPPPTPVTARITQLRTR